MRIQSSSISMSGESSFIQKYSKEETLKAWVGNKRPDFEGQKSGENKLADIQMDILELSEQAKKEIEMKREKNAAVQAGEGALTASGISEEQFFELSDTDKAKIEMLQKMIEALTGKKIRFFLPEKIKIKPLEIKINPNTNAASGQTPKGWGIEYDLHESYYEQAKMSFSSEGVIKTRDGKEISFSVQLNMSREFSAQHNISIRAGDAKIDPLIINFDGNAASLTETKYTFDVDSNGKDEQISFAGKGSGFLALDKNSDGKINDGSELFGTKNADGFAELAQYDDDKNGWIDENDDIFDNLLIWTKDAEGKDNLFAIGAKGIGAIYLGNVDTNFDVKDQGNNSLGEIRKTGIFVKENGFVGTIQHVDLTI